MIQNYHAKELGYSKVKTGISILILTARGAIIDFKSLPVFTDCKYRPVKHLWHWLLVISGGNLAIVSVHIVSVDNFETALLGSCDKSPSTKKTRKNQNKGDIAKVFPEKISRRGSVCYNLQFIEFKMNSCLTEWVIDLFKDGPTPASFSFIFIFLYRQLK